VLTYHAAHKHDDSIVLGEVIDFPGTVSFGHSLDDARINLAGALRDMAETNLFQGESLPLPDGLADDPDADVDEPIYLVEKLPSRWYA